MREVAKHVAHLRINHDYISIELFSYKKHVTTAFTMRFSTKYDMTWFYTFLHFKRRFLWNK